MSPLAKTMHQRNISDHAPVDDRLKRLRDNILPDSPYVLTIPTTFRVSSHQVDDWRRGIPFAADEQKLQYLSFLSHTLDETMLKAEGDWDDGNGGIADKSSQSISTRRTSGTMSPLPGQDRKKKISLADYKKKTAQGGMKASPANIQASITKPKLPEKVDGPAPPAKKEVKPPGDVPKAVQKRPLEAISQDNDAKSARRDQSPPPAKKARVSPSPRVTTSKEEKIEKPNAHGFPPLLSPTLPPSIEQELARIEANNRATAKEKNGHKNASETSISSTSRGLQGQSPSRVHTSQMNSKDKAVLSKKPGMGVSESKKSDMSPNSTKLGSIRGSAVPSKQPTSTLDQKSTGSKANGIAGAKAPSNGTGNTGYETSAVAYPKPITDDSEKESLLVTLKIPKSARKNWAALIRLAPRPRKPEIYHQASIEKLNDRAKDTSFVNRLEKLKEKPMQRKVQSAQRDELSKTGEKRHRLNSSDDPEPSIKRRKPSASPVVIHKTHTAPNQKPHTSAPNQKPFISGSNQKSDTSTPNQKPHTPVRPITKSPTSSHSKSAQKTLTSTSKRTFKGAAMQRIASQEADVQTPSGSTRSGTPTAPASAERGSHDGGSVSNPSVGESSGGNSGDVSRSSVAELNGTDNATLWKHEQNKYLQLGRSLKHKADGFLKVGGMINPDGTAKDHGVAIAVETILCYMLGFTAGDEALRVNGKAGDASSWQSLLPYIQFIKSVVDESHLQGLVLQLEAVCREIIKTYDIDRLMRESIPPGLNDINPDATGQASNASRRDRYEDFKTKLVENIRLARQAWLRGTARLSKEKLAESYPRTWEKRAMAPPDEDAKEKLVLKEYNGGTFYIPLNSTSSGIEAVRLGWSFLGEWCDKYGVKWEGKMGL